MPALAASSQAGQPAPPDPTLQMPDITPTRDRGVIANGWVHFYFHKEGVSYEQAYADFLDCYRFMPPPAMSGSALEAVPDDYALYGLSRGVGDISTCPCLGTVGFSAEPGVITDLGYIQSDIVRGESSLPELRAESGFGPSSGDPSLLGATIRPARQDSTLSPRSAPFRSGRRGIALSASSSSREPISSTGSRPFRASSTIARAGCSTWRAESRRPTIIRAPRP